MCSWKCSPVKYCLTTRFSGCRRSQMNRLVRRASLEGHPNGSTRAQRQSRLRADRLIREKLHVKSLQNHRHNQAHFEHGELVADALVGPAEEGEVGAFGALGHALGSEAVGIE